MGTWISLSALHAWTVAEAAALDFDADVPKLSALAERQPLIIAMSVTSLQFRSASPLVSKLTGPYTLW